MWFFAILVVLAMGGIALVAAGRGTPMARAYDDRPDVLVPRDRELAAGDLRTVRFSVALRGYRMSEVDALLDRLAGEMERRTDAAETPDEATPEAGDRTAAEPAEGDRASE